MTRATTWWASLCALETLPHGHGHAQPPQNTPRFQSRTPLPPQTISNQDGTPIELPEADRRGFTLGALLHAKGAALLAKVSEAVLTGTSKPPQLGQQLEDAARLLEQVQQ